jgi:hydrophobic/amphiphilic exporter-1 (mainly G- bacteria), HAE1 family
VPTFFVVVQRFENWLAGRKSEAPAPEAVATAPGATH